MLRRKSELRAILYEVKNTFNEQHTYVFPVDKNSKIITQSATKSFMFRHLLKWKLTYNFRLAEPKETLSVYIKQKDRRNVTLSLSNRKKRKISTKQLLINFLKHPLMTIKIIMAIHFEALRLWKKGVRLVKKKTKIKNNLIIRKMNLNPYKISENFVLKKLNSINNGRLILKIIMENFYNFGNQESILKANIKIHNPKFYFNILKGSNALAESYIKNDFETSNLPSLNRT